MGTAVVVSSCPSEGRTRVRRVAFRERFDQLAARIVERFRHDDLEHEVLIATGKKLRVPAAATGSTDVYLIVKVEPHPFFTRDGNDILLEVPLDISEAALGAAVEVPTVGGDRLTVKVPAGTSSGTRLRLRAKGITGGDQYLVFQIVVPKSLDDASRELIEAFAKRNPSNPRSTLAWA